MRLIMKGSTAVQNFAVIKLLRELCLSRIIVIRFAFDPDS